MSLPPPRQPSTTHLPLPDPEAYPGEPREYARALMQRKDDIEAEIEILKDVLSSHGVSASTSLIDPEGYPRADIDIYAIRHARSSLARLTTDLHTVSDRLSTALQAAFSPSGPSTSSSSSFETRQANGSKLPNGLASPHRPMRPEADMPDEWPEGVVARVNSVAPGCPAAESGMKVGDLIHSFAGVTAASGGGLQAVGALVNRSEGIGLQTPLVILVVRGEERVRLRLTPRSGWGGRGLLGCHILPA